MSEMESLRQAILAQVTEEGEALLRRARHEHHDLLEKAEAQAMAERDRHRQQALTQVRRRYQQQLQQVDYQKRQAKLTAKQKVLTELFTEALARMEAWDSQQIWQFMEPVLNQFNGQAFELALGEVTQAKFSHDQLEQLQARYPNMALRVPLRHETGFVISQGRIEYNYLFRELLTAVYEEEGYQIANQIFAD